MPEDELEGDQTQETEGKQLEESTEESPYTALEAKIAALELAQRQTVNELRTATGRVQSLASQLQKTNNPETEARLRTELSGVSDLLGLVTDSIDESILPRDVKRRVADAQASIRASAADAEINRRIAAGVASALPQQATNDYGLDTNRIEQAAVAQIRALGLNDQDPAFNWSQAATLLHTQGEPAMWAYFAGIERDLLASTTEAGPQRRGRTAPRAAAATSRSGVDAFLSKDVSDADKIAEMRAQGILQ